MRKNTNVPFEYTVNNKIQYHKDQIDYHKKYIDFLENHCVIHESDTDLEKAFKIYAINKKIAAVESYFNENGKPDWYEYRESTTQYTDFIANGHINDKILETYVKNSQSHPHKDAITLI